MKFHHIGIATKDISKTLVYIKSVYDDIANITEIIYDDLQQASLCMVTLKDGTKIELVSGSQVSTYVKKRIQLYHTCWEVDDINKYIEKHVQEGSILISELKEAILFNNRKVAFLYSELGIIELLEKGIY